MSVTTDTVAVATEVQQDPQTQVAASSSLVPESETTSTTDQPTRQQQRFAFPTPSSAIAAEAASNPFPTAGNQTTAPPPNNSRPRIDPDGGNDPEDDPKNPFRASDALFSSGIADITFGQGGAPTIVDREQGGELDLDEVFSDKSQ
jgi:hypothetical protein